MHTELLEQSGLPREIRTKTKTSVVEANSMVKNLWVRESPIQGHFQPSQRKRDLKGRQAAAGERTGKAASQGQGEQRGTESFLCVQKIISLVPVKCSFGSMRK